MSHETFDGEVGDTFDAYANLVKGWVRYRQVQYQLGQALEGLTGLTVADIGGGSGIDAAWLAGLGHHVVMVEPAEDQFLKAEQRKAALSSAVQSRMQLVRGTVDALLTAGMNHSYDVVVSHCVAMYQADPRQYIGKLGLLARPDGHISLLEKGKIGTEIELSAKTRHLDLGRLEESSLYENELHIPNVRAFMPEELQNYLTHDANARIVDWYGVGITTNLDPRSALAVQPKRLHEMLAHQLWLGKRPGTREAAPLLHYIAVAQ